MPGQFLRSPLRRCLLAGLIVFASVAPATTAYAQAGQKRVLVLYSTRRDAQFSIIGERELPRMLDVGPSPYLDYCAEFIDLARSPEPGYKPAFRDFLHQKYGGIRFDVVIAMHDTAVAFVNEYGDALFPDTPVVFLTNSPPRSRRPNSTGLIHERNFA